MTTTSCAIADLPARMQAKIQVADSGCWIWVGARNGSGYGTTWLGRVVNAHRATYQLLIGDIPPGLQIDHLCRVRPCVNPAHLEPVTQVVNIHRSPRVYLTHCNKGHALEGDNLVLVPRGAHRPAGQVSRMCRACVNLRQNERAARLRAARNAAPA